MTIYLTSNVPEHQGPCVPTWLNRNQVCQRMDGGVSGFFKRVRLWHGIPLCKQGEEFHGIIKWGSNVVESTALKEVD